MQMLYRDFRNDGELVLVMPQRVVSDDERGLLTWRPIGTPHLFRQAADGRDRRSVPFRERHTVPWRLAPRVWGGTHVLHLFRPGRAHSVWWMFDDGFRFLQWYVNLEAPPRRWDDGPGGPAGVDTFDHALDVVAEPDRRWRWKDEEEYLERVGHPAYWTAAEAAGIGVEGERVAADIAAGAFPFDGTWCDFRPDPLWTVPGLPAAGWDRPRVLDTADPAGPGRL